MKVEKSDLADAAQMLEDSANQDLEEIFQGNGDVMEQLHKEDAQKNKTETASAPKNLSKKT